MFGMGAALTAISGPARVVRHGCCHQPRGWSRLGQTNDTGMRKMLTRDGRAPDIAALNTQKPTVEGLLNLVMMVADQIADLPRKDQELTLVSIWGAHEGAGLRAGLAQADAERLADGLDDWIRTAVRMKTSPVARLSLVASRARDG